MPATPEITLDEAYWWLNFTCANLVRPSLRLHLNRLAEAVRADDQPAAEKIVQDFIDNEIHTYITSSPLLEQAQALLKAVKLWNKTEIDKASKKFTDCGGSYLNNPIYRYVLNMREAVEDNPAAAWNFLERLVNLSGRMKTELEAGELFVECGWAAYQMQNRTRAAMLFEDAVRRYNSRDHQMAVVFCILGGIYWELNQVSRALVAWRNSMSRFQILAEKRLTPTETDVRWYNEVIKRLNDSLESIVEQKAQTTTGTPAQPTPPQTTTVTQTTPVQPAQPVRPQGAGPASPIPGGSEVGEELEYTYSSDFIEAFPILEEVPAGPWKNVVDNYDLDGKVDIEQVVIDDRPHYIRSLSREKTVNLLSVKDPVVIQIMGNSMNAAKPTPIENGDYVLLRSANSARHNDIVVAKYYDETSHDTLATIKRYVIDGDPMLKAESTEAQAPLNEAFQVIGIALAVFKPVHRNGKSKAKAA